MPATQWTFATTAALFEMPLMDLLYRAQSVHRKHFKSDEIELCTLLNIKTGACPEDCGYCSQSGHYQTGLKRETLFRIEDVIARAKMAKANGATRFCMGAAWRNPPEKDFPKIIEMIKAVKNEGLETCVTLGMLSETQAAALQAAGLDFYNHNLDTSPEHYKNIVTTRTYQDRLDTLAHVRNAGINICCGGIMGMGESREDRVNFLLQLANLPAPPESVPINRLIPVKGTPLEHQQQIDNIEFVRTIAAARIMMPTSVVRLSAGRDAMTEEMQALCLMAGANSLFLGDTLLTAPNPAIHQDKQLLAKLALKPKTSHDCQSAC